MALLSLRHAAAALALGLLLVPAAAHASTGAPTAVIAAVKHPSVTTVRPMRTAIGATLTIRGKNFRAGKGKNTVVFQRSGRQAVFVKAGIGTKKLVKVLIPDRLDKSLEVRRGLRVPTRFRIRILSAHFGKRFTSTARSPLIAPKPAPVPPPPATPVPPPDIDCDNDGLLNSKDSDDDGDLLPDDQELAIDAQQGLTAANGMQTCNADSDGDGVSDGFEYGSARDLNASFYLPFPGKRPYANPLDPSDAATDFDGDGLGLGSEYRLWRYQLARTGEAPSLATLSYSDGTQYSVYGRDGSGRRTPTLAAAGYDRQADFRAWLAASGYGTVTIPGDTGPRPLLDVNRDGSVSPVRQAGYPTSEDLYYDRDRNGVLSDDERDEDGDGLSNIDETHDSALRFRLDPGYWKSLHPEISFGITYAGTALDDPDTDGDGIRDGADDQDFDDVPNLMELSRQMATGRPLDAPDADALTAVSTPAYGRVNPFNPCLPDPASRTCPRYVPFDSPWAPYDGSPNFFVFN